MINWFSFFQSTLFVLKILAWFIFSIVEEENFSLRIEYNQLVDKYNRLRTNYDRRTSDYNTLNDRYMKLINNYNSLVFDYRDSKKTETDLRAKLDEAETTIEELIKKIETQTPVVMPCKDKK